MGVGVLVKVSVGVNEGVRVDVGITVDVGVPVIAAMGVGPERNSGITPIRAPPSVPTRPMRATIMATCGAGGSLPYHTRRSMTHEPIRPMHPCCLAAAGGCDVAGEGSAASKGGGESGGSIGIVSTGPWRPSPHISLKLTPSVFNARAFNCLTIRLRSALSVGVSPSSRARWIFVHS